MTVLIIVLAVALVAVGLVGILVPALPGTVLIFAGLLLAAWTDGFTRVGAGTLILIGAIGAASYGIDLVAGALGARHGRASSRAVAGATVGSIVGLFFGLPGLILGPFVGAVLGELSAHRDLARAGRAGASAWIGFAIGTALKVALAFSMIAIFLAAWFLF